MEAAQLRPVVDRAFAFEELPDALRHLQAGRHVGKVGLEVASKELAPCTVPARRVRSTPDGRFDQISNRAEGRGARPEDAHEAVHRRTARADRAPSC